MYKKIIIGVAVALVLVFIGYHFLNKHMKGRVADAFTKINAVWAVQGPFKNGAESTKAMRYATEAVGGRDSFNSVINKHTAVYDAHPDRWEEIRKGFLVYAKGKEFETNLESAKKLGAVVNPNYASSPAH